MLKSLFTVLPFAVCLFWTVSYVLNWRRNSAASHVLTIFLSVCTALYLCHAIFLTHSGDGGISEGVAACVYAFCNLAVFPLYYLYIKRLTSSAPLLPIGVVCMMPSIVIAAWATIDLIFLPGNATIHDLQVAVARILFILEIAIVSILGFRHLSAFDRLIDENYSNNKDRSIRPTKWIMVILVTTAVASAIANYIGRFYFFEHPQLVAIPSCVFAILLYAVAFLGTRQTFTIDNVERDTPTQEPTPETVSTEATVFERLETLMREEKTYLQPDLQLSSLAKQLGVGRTTLSSAINRRAEMSFSDYINRLRIEHACTLLARKDLSMSIAELSELSGFASESSFYRLFRRFTGTTPAAFAKRSNLSSEKL